MTLRDLIMKYVEIRFEKSKLADKHKEQLAPYNQALDGLEAVFMREMDKGGVDSISARDCGTIYRSTRSSATVADFNLLKAHIIEHDAWELLQGRVSAVAVEAFLEDTGELPPGVSLSKILKIGVRKN
jgi:hypothetical protein